MESCAPEIARKSANWQASETQATFTADPAIERGAEEPASEAQDDDVGSEDHVLVYPRRKMGEEKMGSERPPVVVTRDYLKSSFHMPLTTVAKNLNISATVLKQLCRRVGIQKWPYKRRKASPNRSDDDKMSEQTTDSAGTASSSYSSPRQDQNETIQLPAQPQTWFDQSTLGFQAPPSFPSHLHQTLSAQQSFPSPLPGQTARISPNTNNSPSPLFSFPQPLPSGPPPPHRSQHAQTPSLSLLFSAPFLPLNFAPNLQRHPLNFLPRNLPLTLAQQQQTNLMNWSPQPEDDFSGDALRFAVAGWPTHRRPSNTCSGSTSGDSTP